MEVGRGSSTAHPSKLSPRVVPAHFPGYSKDLAFNVIELKKILKCNFNFKVLLCLQCDEVT